MVSPELRNYYSAFQIDFTSQTFSDGICAAPPVAQIPRSLFSGSGRKQEAVDMRPSLAKTST